MRILGRKGPHDLAFFAKVVQVNLVGTFNVMTLAAEKIAETEPARARRPGSGDQHGFGRGVRRTDRPGGVRIVQERGGGPDPALRRATWRNMAYGCSTIAPGIVETPMLATVSDEFRAGLASDIPFPQRLARLTSTPSCALDLVAHDYLNGEVIRMDGALRMAPR